jgi:hypothetical protein
MQRNLFSLASLSALVVAVGAVLVFAVDDAGGRGAAQAEARLAELLQDRVVASERAVEATKAGYEIGTVSLEAVIDAVNKRAEARLAVAASDAERTEALRARVDFLQKMEGVIEAKYKEGRGGGEIAKYSVVLRERQSAEIALIQATLRPKAGP